MHGLFFLGGDRDDKLFNMKFEHFVADLKVACLDFVARRIVLVAPEFKKELERKVDSGNDSAAVRCFVDRLLDRSAVNPVDLCHTCGFCRPYHSKYRVMLNVLSAFIRDTCEFYVDWLGDRLGHAILRESRTGAYSECYTKPEKFPVKDNLKDSDFDDHVCLWVVASVLGTARPAVDSVVAD